MPNSKVLVTGAGGYIGSILVPKLIGAGYKVKAIDRFFFGRNKLESNARLEQVQEDVRRISTEHLSGVEYVIDLAAISNDPSSELFQKATWQINHEARVRVANLAKEAGAKRYIFPSSCSIYGFHNDIVNENSPTNPLTTYARANEMAERDIIKIHDDDFTVTIIRQATVFGYSPRMRFDLAVNGMVYGAYKTGKLPLMMDGTQCRPIVHVHDTTDVMCQLLEAPSEAINGQIFNVGYKNFRLIDLAKEVSEALPFDVDIEWYGDPDKRSYSVSFDKIWDVLKWKAKRSVSDGVKEVHSKILDGSIDKTTETITLDWYQELVKWHKIIKDTEMYGGMLDIQQS